MHLAVLLIYALLVAVLVLASGSAVGLGDLVFDWRLFFVGVVVGTVIYGAAAVLYYVLFCDDVLVVGHQDFFVRRSLAWINQARASVGRMPLWVTPPDAQEQGMVRVARDCLAHIQEELSFSPTRGRRAGSAGALQTLAYRLGDNLLQALWSLSWSREITQKLASTDGSDSQHIAAIQHIQQREERRFRRSFNSLVSLATALAELGSEIQEGDMERLLSEFGEITLQMEEDAQALQEVRRSRLS